MPKKAIIIGAGPAGLTAAYELLKRTDIVPIILEKSDMVGGISRTYNFKGNRMDMGPHRFFSKSDRVMNWWLKIMPLEEGTPKKPIISYQNKSREVTNETSSVAKDPNKVMLVIRRLTRIYFLRQFFGYPIQLSIDTLKTLGFMRTLKIIFSFMWIRLFPRKPEKSLEDFIINKFGKTLYLLFFKDYTEKVWGIAPSQISAEWGAQRIKGVSLSKAIAEAIKSLSSKKKAKRDISQKEVETSLIEQFLYPKYGPGSLWEEVAQVIHELGGKVYLNQDVNNIVIEDGRITSVITTNLETSETFTWEGEYFFSTMPVQELIAGITPSAPSNVREIAAGLVYRDFINVGILLKQLSTKGGKKIELKDNWIYIQEKDVKVGRLMIYNSWGDGMIKDPNTIWIGMEYFCNKTDDLWALSDNEIQALAIRELEQMDLAQTADILDSTVRRMEKTYPAYFGTYDQFDTIKSFVNQFENLFLIGRNGMHKYNNADHSMLCAMVAVDNIIAGLKTKDNLWSINTEQEYLEEKRRTDSAPAPKKSIAKKNKGVFEDFKAFVLDYRENRNMLLFAGLAILVQFIIFKLLYPYASFIDGDSYVYINTAAANPYINTYPIGYPRFLRLFSVFTKSDTALVSFQYLMIMASSLWLLFTLFYLYKPSRLTKWIMLILFLFNPVFLYISNYVLSDALFLSLSLIWVALLIWIIHRPGNKLIFWQLIVLLLAFTVRYSALYYPVITLIALLISKATVRQKLFGITASFSVIAAFIVFTATQYKALTGIWEYTPFSGWQIANNAMYAYRFVDSSDRKTTPKSLQELDNTVRKYFDTSRNLRTHPVEMLVASTVYMWDPKSPLNLYMKQVFKKDSAPQFKLKDWATIAPLYRQYGSFIAQTYPKIYFKHYIIPNALKFYTPPSEFLEAFNMGRDSIGMPARNWFGYTSKKTKTAFKDLKINSIAFVPILFGIMNIVFIFGFISMCLLPLMNRKITQSKIIIVVAVLWLFNFGFSVIASPITIRYQLFAFILFTWFALIFIDKIYKIAFEPTQTKSNLGL